MKVTQTAANVIDDNNNNGKSAVHQTTQLFAKEWARRQLLSTEYWVLNELRYPLTGIDTDQLVVYLLATNTVENRAA